MKDSEFIELLNLYLDHEITPANAARLEDEVRRNPGRRRIYLQYCGIHKACGIIAADFSTARPAPRRESVAAGLGWAAAGFASFGGRARGRVRAVAARPGHFRRTDHFGAGRPGAD